jgi:hypothetical protein
MFGLENFALIALFFIFVYLIYKGIKLLFRYLLIAGVSAAFPIIAIKYLGFSWPLTLGTILAFVYLGILGYTIYLGLSIVEKIGKPIIGIVSGKKKKEKQIEKRVKELEKKEKEKE